MKRGRKNARTFVLFLSLVAILGVAFFLAFPTQRTEVSAAAKPLASRLTATYAEYATVDAVTNDIRSASKSMFRVSTVTPAERKAAPNIGTIVRDYGSFVVVASDRTKKAERAGLDVQPLETSINLPGAKFDPILDPPTDARSADAFDKQEGYYIVQFGMTVDDAMLDSLRDAGLEVLQYVPNQAFLVYGKADAVGRAAAHSRVRWVGEFLPTHKLPDVLTRQLADARGKSRLSSNISRLEMTGKDTSIFNVAVFKRRNLGEAANEIAFAYGANVVSAIDLPNNFFNIVRVEVPIGRVESIANIPDVIRIDSWQRPVRDDERTNQISAGNYTNSTTIAAPGYNPLTQFGVDGTNVTVSVVDDGVSIPGNGGFYVTAANTVNAPLRGATAGATGHGHLNASIIAGNTPFGALDPTGYNYGLGIAPKSNIINVPFLKTGYIGTDADLYNDTLTTAGPNGVFGFVSNNSWGAGVNANAYNAMAAEWDGFVRDSSTAASIDPICMVFSAGNQGASGLTQPKVSKNMISTASGENIRTELDSTANNMDDISSFSSRGPAADTRVKPDISAPGQAISGGQAGTDALFGNIGTDHRWSSGTSHAAPQVAGGAALFTQFWKNGHAGANPSPALVKAALINGAVDMTGSTTSAAPPNGVEGWGRMNLKNVLNTGVTTTYVNQTAPLLSAGDVKNYSGTVADNTKPLRVSLVWTDPPGVADPALVNNLDLTVTVGGNTYKGNVLTGGVSTTGGTADIRNNVENVFVPAGVSGPVNIAVIATALNGDGILGDIDLTDQHYALVVYNSNVTEALAPAVALNSAPTVASENKLPLNGVPDPGETLTMNIALSNVGTANTTNLVATLQPTGGVTAPSGPQNYGALAAGGSAVTRQFTYTANGQCGGTITLTFALNDNGTDLGNVVIPLTLGTTQTTTSFTQNFDGITAPALPAGWTAATTVGTLPVWVTSTTTPDTAPNDAFAGAVTTVSNTEIVTPTIAIPAGGGQLTFRNLYNTEIGTGAFYDGMVLEIAIGAGAFTDIVAAGGSFVAGGYTGTISTGFSSPIAGRQAWSGLSGGTTAAPTYITSTVNLPSAANGQNIRLKWRMATDSSAVAGGTPGVRVDSLSIASSSPVCSTVTPAEVEVSGRVLTSDGRGLTNAKVTITDDQGQSRTLITRRNGSFVFTEVEAGRTYVISVQSRRFTFAPRVLEITDNVSGLEFYPDN